MYIGILTWNMIFFIQKNQFCDFIQSLRKICGFLRYLLRSVPREPVTMASNHKETLLETVLKRSDGLSNDTTH